MALLPPVRATFRALVTTFVPEAAALGAAEWAEVEAIVEQALAERPAGLRRQVVLLMRALEWLPAARFGRRLSRLDPARRTRVLGRLERSPLLLLRRGIWGLRTLAFMGYYARPAAADQIGYRAHLRGWEARGSR